MLTSRRNPRVHRLRSLHEPRGRDQEGLFLVEGLRFVESALDATAPLEEVWTSPRLVRSPRGEALLQRLLTTPGLTQVEASDEVLEAICTTRNHQGVVGTCRPWPEPPPPLSPRKPDLVILCDLQDPGNTGTLWRSAAAAGMGRLVCGRAGADPYNPKAIRAAAGAAFVLPMERRAVDLAYLEDLREQGFHLVGAAGEGNARYDALPWSAPVALLIGQEGPGLPDPFLDLCHETARIPMAEGVESLNAALSGTLLMYELARARGFSTLLGMSPED